MRVCPSSTKCSKAAAAPASPSKRTDGRRGASVSIITTFSSGPSASGAVTSNRRYPSTGPARSASNDCDSQCLSFWVSTRITM